MEKEFLISKDQVDCLAHGFREAVYSVTGYYGLGEEACFTVKDYFYDHVSPAHQKFNVKEGCFENLGRLVNVIIGRDDQFSGWRAVAKHYVNASKAKDVPLSRDVLTLLDRLCFATLGWEK